MCESRVTWSRYNGSIAYDTRDFLSVHSDTTSSDSLSSIARANHHYSRFTVAITTFNVYQRV